MTIKPLRKCPNEIFAGKTKFSEELIAGDWEGAVDKLQSLNALDAVSLVLASFRHQDAIVGEREMDDLAEALGVFDDDTDTLKLFCQSGSDYSIVDHNGVPWTVEDSQEAWEAGRVEDYNLALKRLSELDWDVERLKAHYAAGGR